MDSLSYLAGIIDGEGCIVCRATKPGRPYELDLRITVGNTDTRLLDWLQQTWGGPVHWETRTDGRRDLGLWSLAIRRNREICQRLIPELLIKRRQLELALEAADLSITRGHGQRIPPENAARRLAIVAEVMRLKHEEGRHARA